ncbi:endonuclease/exonuclease/phosphatase family protein [Maribacter flavus]|uniref:Endonuclease/exonuclease/phosphatase family protein n=1 Tax=Maribacter flavus TaxID=1658664 RepID=A0A5B2U032_9FLAO|nr:endonuclease/exonuclease/phosphatase family protein [Maribacter flavus]KAA2219290.1 endonuclease/exonuclease/phosphatase family protein [Maribacter flavus]
MKIISWNCNGAFRKKFDIISSLDADIYVIQECEDPSRTRDRRYIDWSNNHLWIGDSKNKGLGIFAKSDIKLEQLVWSNNFRDHSVKYFLPCLVDNKFQLLGVWTHRNNSPNFGYMGQFWKYLETNFKYFENPIIAGDFNSNAIWDQWDRWWNHSDVVQILKQKQIESIYHIISGEEQGCETTPTFWLQKNAAKPYHIDYVFLSKEFQKPKSFKIGERSNWIEFSDHVPLILEL